MRALFSDVSPHSRPAVRHFDLQNCTYIVLGEGTLGGVLVTPPRMSQLAMFILIAVSGRPFLHFSIFRLSVVMAVSSSLEIATSMYVDITRTSEH